MAQHKSVRRAVSNRDRSINSRPARERIFIICEGEKTEPNYFEAIRERHKLNTVVLLKIEGAARVGKSLVEYAIKKKEEADRENEGYKEVWCVFDEDSLKDGFDNAVSMIRAKPFLREAWSNEAFELWYILHFEYLNTSVTRDFYKKRLNSLVKDIGFTKYEKNSPKMYEALGVERLKTASQNARKLLATHDDTIPCHERKPATMVFELVERLLSYAPDNPLGN